MRYFLLILFAASFVSCSNNATDPSAAVDSAITANPELRPSELREQELRIKREQYYIWEVDADKKTIRTNPHLQPEYFNVDTLITGLNEKYPEILLEKKRISNDTLYAEIRNAEYLTNQMGSLGAEQYIAQAVINLTSVEGIKYVRINFKEGSHAAPDVWSRESFTTYREEDNDELQ